MFLGETCIYKHVFKNGQGRKERERKIGGTGDGGGGGEGGEGGREERGKIQYRDNRRLHTILCYLLNILADLL